MVATREAGGVSRRLWTRKEYERMGEVGTIGPEERTELIDGVIYRMAPLRSQGASTIHIARDVLAQAFGAGTYVRIQAPIVLGDFSEPEPDLAVVEGAVRDHLDYHPTTALLVVEVSDTTVAFDRRVKGRLYAAAGLPEYWILNLQRNQLEVHRDPSPTGYQSVTILKRRDTVCPLARPDASISVADLLP